MSEAYEQALTNLTNEVNRLASMMDRLITVEERNNQLDQKIDFIREAFQKDVNTLNNSLSGYAKKIDDLTAFMWKASAIGSLLMVIVVPTVSILVNKVF